MTTRPTTIQLSHLEQTIYFACQRQGRNLLGKPYPRTNEPVIQSIEHPLAWLMAGLPISDEAAAVTQEDIRLYSPQDGG